MGNDKQGDDGEDWGMREIKFRAWDKKYDDFIHDGYIILNGMIYRDDRDFEDGINTNDIELMHYTGLKDKNSVEIYEGDIVKYERCYHRCNINEFVGVVEYDNELLYYLLDFNIAKQTIDHDLSKSMLSSDGFIVTRNYEVIGNIYENPELLS